MNQDDAIEVLAATFQKLAHEGYVVEGRMTFLKPKLTGKVDNLVTFERGAVGAVSLVVAKPPSSIQVKITPLDGSKLLTEISNVKPTGDICPNCHGCNLKPSGSCHVCIDCGSTTGCS